MFKFCISIASLPDQFADVAIKQNSPYSKDEIMSCVIHTITNDIVSYDTFSKKV